MVSKSYAAGSQQEIYVNEIEFWSRNEINLYGFVNNGGKFRETKFGVSRKDLQVLLSRNKPAGLEILWHIEKLFLHPHGIPASINLVNIFGTTQVFKISTAPLTSVVPDDVAQLEALNYTFL